MNTKSVIISILLAISCMMPAFATAPLAEADSAYAAKEYRRAILLYDSIATYDGVSSDLLYNLGNAYFQEGDYGNAMLCYRRAHRLNPSDEDIRANLNYLSSRVEDANKAEQKGKRYKVGEDEPSFFQSVYKAVACNVSSNLWAGWAAVFFILFIGCVALYIFTSMVLLRKIGFFGGMVLLGASVVFLIFAFMGANAYNSEEEGVLMPFKTVLQTEPGNSPDNEKGLILTKGTVVRIVSEEVDAEGNVTWYKVRLNSDYIGWVAVTDLQII